MTETPRPDPWAQVRTFDVSTYGDCRMERDYYGDITSEQTHQRGEYAWVDEVDAARAADAARLAEQAETIARLRKLAYIDPEHAFEDATYQTRFNELVPENREQAETIRQLQILGNNADKLADREGENRKSWQRRAEAAEARCAILTAALEKAIADTRSDALLSKNPIRAELMNVAHRFADALAAAPQGDKA